MEIKDGRAKDNYLDKDFFVGRRGDRVSGLRIITLNDPDGLMR